MSAEDFIAGPDPANTGGSARPLPEQLEAALQREPADWVAETWYGGAGWYMAAVQSDCAQITPRQPLSPLEGTMLELQAGELPDIELLATTVLGAEGDLLRTRHFQGTRGVEAGQLDGALRGVLLSSLLAISQLPRQVARSRFLFGRDQAATHAFGSEWEERHAGGELEITGEAITAFEQQVPTRYEQRAPDLASLSLPQQREIASALAEEAADLCSMIAYHMPEAFIEHPDWFDPLRQTAFPAPLLRQPLVRLRNAIGAGSDLSPQQLITAYMEGTRSLFELLAAQRIRDHRLTDAREGQMREHVELLADPGVKEEVLTATPGTIIKLTDPNTVITPTRLRELTARTLRLVGSGMLLECLFAPDADQLDLPFLDAFWQRRITLPGERLLKPPKKGKTAFGGSVLNVRAMILTPTREWIDNKLPNADNISPDHVRRLAFLADLKSSGQRAVAQGVEAAVFASRDTRNAARFVIHTATSTKVHNRDALSDLIARSAEIGHAVTANAMVRPVVVAPPGSGKRRK
jgi:hypothetical protein